jgi:hypothetical protein
MRKADVANLVAASLNTLLCGALIWRHHELLKVLGKPSPEQIDSLSRFEAAMFAYVLAIYVISYVTAYKRLSLSAQVAILLVSLTNLRVEPPYVLGTVSGGIALMLAAQFAPLRNPYRWWSIVCVAAFGSAAINFFLYRGMSDSLYTDSVTAGALGFGCALIVGWILRRAEGRLGPALMTAIICGVLTPLFVLLAH